MKLLLHICCAPCLIYPLDQLRKVNFDVSGLFYNPNIHPLAEYQKRKAAVEDFSKDAKVEVIFSEYNPQEFFRTINLKETTPERCRLCWKLRLDRTAKIAKEKGFSYFTTTLLVSPYQDQELLKKIGNQIAEETNIKFYYQDFRPGFYRAHNEAKQKGIYCQMYCGCIYSELERCRSLEKRS